MTKNCEVCNKPFSVTGKVQMLKEKTCSLACRRKRKKCVVCGKKFPKLHGKKVCSEECYRQRVNAANREQIAKRAKKNQQYRSA